MKRRLLKESARESELGKVHPASPLKAVLLVGGKGTRLRPVISSSPKPLASVGNKSFLELLVRQLRHQGIHNLVMCTGHLSEQITNEFGDGRKFDVTIEYSKETNPLGTGGAIKLAERNLRDVSEFIVMNGDSFLEIDFQQLIRFHREHGGILTIAAFQVKNATRYGQLQVDANGRVVSFAEKAANDVPGLISAGVYVFNKAVLALIPHGPSSLERDVLPGLLHQGVFAFEQHGLFIDIGTPDDYARAQDLCNRLYDAALDRQYSR